MPFDLGYPSSQSRLTRPGYHGTSLQEVAMRFSTDDACIEYVMKTRFGQDLSCDKCGGVRRWSRRTSTKYALRCCGAVVSPLAGTVFDHTRLPLRLWFYAMLHFANSHAGVNSGFLERHLGIGNNAAFRMAHKIRLHLAELERMTPIATPGQTVEVRVENLHHIRSDTSGHNRTNVLLAARNGRVACQVIGVSQHRSVYKAIAKMVPGHGDLRTTCHRTARIFSDYGSRRPHATYLPTYYMDNPDEVDAIKGFMSYFLWPLHTHHKYVSRAYLWLYLSEFQFRYNRRNHSAQTYWDMIGAFPHLISQWDAPAIAATKDH